MATKWRIDINDLAKAMLGEVLAKFHSEFFGVTTDTRKDNKGKIFFALKGENHDAHDYLEQAVKSGATAIVLHKSDIKFPDSVSIIKVEDTLVALQKLANYWRHKHKAKIIGLTGTNGKTTTKDFAHTLIGSKFKTICTQGNLNNFIGLPLSLLQLDKSVEVGVFEMGLSIPNEMKLLAKIAEPDVVTVTSVGRAHLEGFGTLEVVAANKGQIYTDSGEKTIRVYNLDNEYTKKMLAQCPSGSKTITFSSKDPSADVNFKETISTIDYLEIQGTIAGEPGKAKIPIFGRHNINNLMCASALALAVGVDADHIWKALPRCKGYWGRNQIVSINSGARVLFDAYNANPESVNALLENVSRLKVEGKLYAIFGDMLELGADSDRYHTEWAEKSAPLGFEHIWFVGEKGESFAQGLHKSGFRNKISFAKNSDEPFAKELKAMLKPGDVVLIKGSRGKKLERALMQLEPVEFSPTAKS